MADEIQKILSIIFVNKIKLNISSIITVSKVNVTSVSWGTFTGALSTSITWTITSKGVSITGFDPPLISAEAILKESVIAKR